MYLKMLVCLLIILLTLLIPEQKSEDVRTFTETGSTSNSSNTSITPEDFRLCPLSPKTCRKAKSFKKTKHLICYTSEDCGSDFACCSDACYEHKICKNVKKYLSSSTTESGNLQNAITESPLFELIEAKSEICPHEESPCAKRAEVEKTGLYLCVDDECPKGYKCCKDSCFAHKICKEVKATNKKIKFWVPLKLEADVQKGSNNSNLRAESVLTTENSKKFKESKNTENPTTQETVKTHKPEEFKESEKNITKEKAVKSNSLEKSEVIDEIERHTIKKLFAKIEKHEESKETEKPTIEQKAEKNEKPEEFEDSVWIKGFPSTTNKPNGEDSQSNKCPPEDILCSFPLIDKENAISFNCDKNKCPVNFICCKDNCFKHRICKEL